MEENFAMSFENLDPSLQRAVVLLKKRWARAALGVGRKGTTTCPIHEAYGIIARPRWNTLSFFAKVTLWWHGWKEEDYNSFIMWHDVAHDSSAEHHFLKSYLLSPEN